MLNLFTFLLTFFNSIMLYMNTMVIKLEIQKLYPEVWDTKYILKNKCIMKKAYNITFDKDKNQNNIVDVYIPENTIVNNQSTVIISIEHFKDPMYLPNSINLTFKEKIFFKVKIPRNQEVSINMKSD